jgi:hypothetical protein
VQTAASTSGRQSRKGMLDTEEVAHRLRPARKALRQECSRGQARLARQIDNDGAETFPTPTPKQRKQTCQE